MHIAGFAKWKFTRNLKIGSLLGSLYHKIFSRVRDRPGVLAERRRKFCQLISTQQCNDMVWISLTWAKIKKERKKLLPRPKISLQPRNSWGWSTVLSCDIVRYRASVRHRCDPRQLRVARSRCRSKSMSHDITWSHCRSISWISRL